MKPLDLQSPGLHNNAHAVFKRLRERGPVARARFNRRDVFLITRYADVDALLSGDRLVKDPANTTLGPGAPRVINLPGPLKKLMTSMISVDDPDHRRLRRLIAKAFTPKTIADLAPTMERIAAEQLQRLTEARRGDLIAAFALPFPVHVITQLVGVPAHDRPRFQRWVHDITTAPGFFALLKILPAIVRFTRYIAQLAADKRQNPGPDLLSGLVHVEDSGERISDDELVAMVFLLLTAGHETTVSLIANGTLALLQHPDQLADLRAHPERMGAAIEELLRFDGPLLTTDPYYARDAITLDGEIIPAGAVVLPAVLSANRDASVFQDPDRLDLTRAPNKHLTFGKGLHHCIGAPLARMEATIALRLLLDAAPQLRLAAAPAPLRYRRAAFLHRLEALPVELT